MTTQESTAALREQLLVDGTQRALAMFETLKREQEENELGGVPTAIQDLTERVLELLGALHSVVRAEGINEIPSYQEAHATIFRRPLEAA